MQPSASPPRFDLLRGVPSPTSDSPPALQGAVDAEGDWEVKRRRGGVGAGRVWWATRASRLGSRRAAPDRTHQTRWASYSFCREDGPLLRCAHVNPTDDSDAETHAYRAAGSASPRPCRRPCAPAGCSALPARLPTGPTRLPVLCPHRDGTLSSPSVGRYRPLPNSDAADPARCPAQRSAWPSAMRRGVSPEECRHRRHMAGRLLACLHNARTAARRRLSRGSNPPSPSEFTCFSLPPVVYPALDRIPDTKKYPMVGPAGASSGDCFAGTTRGTGPGIEPRPNPSRQAPPQAPWPALTDPRRGHGHASPSRRVRVPSQRERGGRDPADRRRWMRESTLG